MSRRGSTNRILAATFLAVGCLDNPAAPPAQYPAASLTALTAEGKAYCWGSNEHGQLGIGRHGGSVAQPAAVAGGPAAFRTVTAGRDFTCGLATTDEAWCWGGNEAGQLGDGTLQDRDAPVPVRRPRP